ncbi:hypothetical protein NE237_008465 [Protea cynaroides]|uniref:TAFII55 protein conserved region domain-containing protein n=1 Tax=Protea cynaroides TaxID=273540 RepID=A0A9Q0QZT4_9MAGN|nr:hypothetical protein NE237_008465 [Protea cynaroides]
MEEQFILRVPPSVAERIDRVLNENALSSEDNSLDLSFSDMLVPIYLSDQSLTCNGSHADDNAWNAAEKNVPTPAPKPDVPETRVDAAGEPERSDSDDSLET